MNNFHETSNSLDSSTHDENNFRSIHELRKAEEAYIQNMYGTSPKNLPEDLYKQINGL